MADPNASPAPGLRGDIEVFPMTHLGQQGVVVRDTLGLFSEPVLVQGLGLTVLGLLDGERTVQDIQLVLVRMQKGVFISQEDVEGIISELDSALILDSETYRTKRDRMIKDYLDQGTREAKLAGSAYPSSAGDLAAALDKILIEDKEGAAGSPLSGVKAVVAPHIDIEIGKAVYARAYNTIKDLKPSRILILGTGHHLQDAFFSLTEKEFISPLGMSPTDRERVAKLKEAGGDLVAPHDITHRGEHSIEFQLVFLQHLFGTDIPLIPLLCGSFHEILAGYDSPREVPGMAGFLDEMKGMLEEDPDMLIVAGVDFAHIGPKFGHRENASTLLQETQAFDHRLINRICETDAQGFWDLYRSSGGKYNVCGLSALSVLLDLIPDCEGHNLGYDMWQEEPTRSAVSFAAVAFTRPAAG